jgi:ribonuclease HI
MKITVWTDGSSHHNGKPNCVAGWSAVFMMGKKTYIRYGHLPAPSSNNRGEICGVLYAIQTFNHRKDWELEIYSDSQYVVKSINEWRRKWKLHNYVGIKNEDLFVPLFNAWDEHGNASISWVRGHTGVRGNELADEYAGMGSNNEHLFVSNDAYDIKRIEWIEECQKLLKIVN